MSPDEIRFRSLLIAMENKTISFRAARIIVGGEARLTRLMESGKIRYEKKHNYIINAADCYRNIRPRKQVLNNSKC